MASLCRVRPLSYHSFQRGSLSSFGNVFCSVCQGFSTSNHGKNNPDKNKTINNTKTSDPPILTQVDRLPLSIQPYARLARLDKPIGTWLLFWPCAWGTALAGVVHSAVPLGVLFGLGSLVMRGAGCTMNDLLDQDLDKQVERCSDRPLAAGTISNRQAVAFLGLQLSIGLGVLLSLPHTWFCFQLGTLSLPLVAVYPTTKRYFPYPQVVLGLTINWGVLMGWAASHGSLDPVVLPLYGSAVCWTVLYDTIYAHQDKKDDAKLNLKSTALTFGDCDKQQKKILHGLAVACLSQWMLTGYWADLALPFYLGSLTAYSHLVWQIHTANFDDPHNLAARFRSNSTVGAILFASLSAGQVFA